MIFNKLKEGIKKMNTKYPDSKWKEDFGRRPAVLNQWVGGICLAVNLKDRFVCRENKKFIQLFGDHRWVDRPPRPMRTAPETGIVMYVATVLKNLASIK